MERVAWRSALMVHFPPSVMTAGAALMLKWCADNWDTIMERVRVCVCVCGGDGA